MFYDNFSDFSCLTMGRRPAADPPPITKVQDGDPPAWIIAILRAKRAGTFSTSLLLKYIIKPNMMYIP